MELEGLYQEVRLFTQKHNYKNEDLMIVMNEVYMPEDFNRLEITTLFGIELTFSPHIDDILIARKFSAEFLNFEGFPQSIIRRDE